MDLWQIYDSCNHVDVIWLKVKLFCQTMVSEIKNEHVFMILQCYQSFINCHVLLSVYNYIMMSYKCLIGVYNTVKSKILVLFTSFSQTHATL